MEEDAITPKKYIRTFAGDIEILKSGGKPNLAPLVESKSTPAERLIAASPVPAEVPIPPPQVEEPIQKEQPTPEVIKPTPIETYASDFSDKMKEENASPVTVLAAEQDATKIETQTTKSAPHSRGGILYTVFGIVFIMIGAAGIYIAYMHYASSLAPVTLAPTISAPIFVDEREQISGVGPALVQAIEQSVTKQLAPNTVRLLYTTNATTTDNTIFSALRVPAPDVLLRNINANGSMAGIVNVGGAQSPFFILSVASYSGTFSGMLSWESSMPKDLSNLFPAYPNSSATSTISFRDEVVDNHDVRIYRDIAGRSIILYGYWNETTLVIARDPSVFTEIVDRLATSQAQH
jgi:hypothetical protein